MLKYCNGCKRDLEIDKFYSYKKSILKEFINKKVKCDYCDKEFNSTNLSKHIKQIHSTYNTSNINDSTSNNSTYNASNTNDSTSNKTDKNNEPLYSTIEDSLYLNKYIKLMKDKINNLDIKTQDKINRIFTKNRILHDKIKNITITKREEKQYENNLSKLRDLNSFDEIVCKILQKYKYLD